MENRIRTTTADANEETVINDMINDAKIKFHAPSPQFDSFVRKVAKVVIWKHRRVVDADSAEDELDVICETFQEDIQIVAVSSSNTSNNVVPQHEMAQVAMHQRCVIKTMDMEFSGPNQITSNVLEDFRNLKCLELETRKYEAELACKKEEAGIRKAAVETEAQLKIAELQANATAKKAEVETEAQLKIAELEAHANARKAEAQVKIAELEASTNAQKVLEDSKIAHAQAEAQVKQTEAQVKIAELQARRAPEDAKIAQAQAKKAEWEAKAKIAESQLQLQGKKREREETTESTKPTAPKKVNPPKPLAERLAAHTQTYRGAMSFSHAVYQKLQDLGGDIDIVTVFQFVQEWFNAGQRRGFHLNAPRDMDSVIIVYGNKFSDDLLEHVATDCLKTTPQCLGPVVMTPLRTASLLSAVVGVLPHDRQAAATNIFINEFVCNKVMEPWHGVTYFVVRHRLTHEVEDITTHVDVQTHPIVTELQDWLRIRIMDRPAVTPGWSPAQDLDIQNYPDSAGLGPFNADDVHDAFIGSHAAVASFLREHWRRYHGGLHACMSLRQAVHPDQAIFEMRASQE